MSTCPKSVFLLIIAFSAIFLFWPGVVFAQVVINEFVPTPSNGPDWVKLYNNSDQEVNLGNWVLDDEGTSTNMHEIKEATISAHGFLFFEVSNRLNKSEDTVYLKNQDGQEVDSYHYGVDLGIDISFGRMPDGGVWGTCLIPTKGEINNCRVSTPTPTTEPEEEIKEEFPLSDLNSDPIPTPAGGTPTPTKKPTPKPTPTPTPTPSGEILGEEATPEAEVISFNTTQESTPSSFHLQNFLPFIFIGLGSLFLAIAGGSVLLPQIKKKYNIKRRGENKKII